MCRIAGMPGQKAILGSKKSEMCLSEDTAEIIYTNQHHRHPPPA